MVERSYNIDEMGLTDEKKIENCSPNSRGKEEGALMTVVMDGVPLEQLKISFSILPRALASRTPTLRVLRTPLQMR